MGQYSDSELLNELKRLAEEFDHPPTLRELREHGKYAATTYYNRFGSFQKALEAAGFSARSPNARISNDNLISELHRVADKTNTGKTPKKTNSGDHNDTPPTAADMNEYGNYWASTYRRWFGSWNAALRAAGFDPLYTTVTEADLITELRRLAEELNKTPTFAEMNEQGRHGARTYVRRFGSWNDALETAGLKSRASSTISDEELISELRQLANRLGERPSAQQMDDHGEYASATYQRHFGSWSATLDKGFTQADES